LRWTPVVLAGYPALGLSGAVDPFEASESAWLTPLGGGEWQHMRGACLPDLGLSDGTLVRFPGVPAATGRRPRSSGDDRPLQPMRGYEQAEGPLQVFIAARRFANRCRMVA
jgi:hypothetical protein